MSHPFASQSASSTARRLKAIGGKGASAGKAWGSTAMSSKGGGRSYPSKNAGSQVPYFAEGGSVGTRPDRMARGGKGKKKGHTTNVVVNIPPSGGPPIGAAPGLPPGPPPAPPIPIQVPRAAPPVAPGPMPVAGPGPMPVRPPVVLPPGARPPGMKRGGSVKHMADGEFMDTSNQPLGQGGPQQLPGWNSGLKKGGSVKRAQLGMAVPPAAAARARSCRSRPRLPLAPQHWPSVAPLPIAPPSIGRRYVMRRLPPIPVPRLRLVRGLTSAAARPQHRRPRTPSSMSAPRARSRKRASTWPTAVASSRAVAALHNTARTAAIR